MCGGFYLHLFNLLPQMPIMLGLGSDSTLGFDPGINPFIFSDPDFAFDSLDCSELDDPLLPIRIESLKYLTYSVSDSLWVEF